MILLLALIIPNPKTIELDVHNYLCLTFGKYVKDSCQQNVLCQEKNKIVLDLLGGETFLSGKKIQRPRIGVLRQILR